MAKVKVNWGYKSVAGDTKPLKGIRKGLRQRYLHICIAAWRYSSFSGHFIGTCCRRGSGISCSAPPKSRLWKVVEQATRSWWVFTIYGHGGKRQRHRYRRHQKNPPSRRHWWSMEVGTEGTYPPMTSVCRWCSTLRTVGCMAYRTMSWVTAELAELKASRMWRTKY